VGVEEYAYYINTLHQNVGLATGIWASNCDVTKSAHQMKMPTIYHWMKPPMKIFCVRHWTRYCFSVVSLLRIKK